MFVAERLSIEARSNKSLGPTFVMKGDHMGVVERIIRLFPKPSSEKSGASAGVKALCAELKSKDYEVRGEAANNLGAIGKGSDRAVKALIAALKDVHFGVRTMAASSLGIIGDRSATEPLLEAINDPNYQVRDFVGNALGRIGEPRAIEPLIAGLKHDYPVRQAAAQHALVLMGAVAIEPLEALLRDNSITSFTRELVTEAIASIKH
jgi:HEAT repeat protein